MTRMPCSPTVQNASYSYLLLPPSPLFALHRSRPHYGVHPALPLADLKKRENPQKNIYNRRSKHRLLSSHVNSRHTERCVLPSFRKSSTQSPAFLFLPIHPPRKPPARRLFATTSPFMALRCHLCPPSLLTFVPPPSLLIHLCTRSTEARSSFIIDLSFPFGSQCAHSVHSCQEPSTCSIRTACSHSQLVHPPLFLRTIPNHRWPWPTY